jgi:hypothetical protein
MKDKKLKCLKKKAHTFNCFQHDFNNDQNNLCIGYILNYFMCIYAFTNSYMGGCPC